MFMCFHSPTLKIDKFETKYYVDYSKNACKRYGWHINTLSGYLYYIILDPKVTGIIIIIK